MEVIFKILTKAVEKIVIVITYRAFITVNVFIGFVGYPLYIHTKVKFHFNRISYPRKNLPRHLS